MNSANIEGPVTPEQRFHYLNDSTLQRMRHLPIGEVADLTGLQESLRDIDDAELIKTFRLLHGNIVDDERALDMVTEEIAKREAYKPQTRLGNPDE